MLRFTISVSSSMIFIFLIRNRVKPDHHFINQCRKTRYNVVAPWMLHQGHDNVLITGLFVDDDAAVCVKRFPGSRFPVNFSVRVRFFEAFYEFVLNARIGHNFGKIRQMLLFYFQQRACIRPEIPS